MTEAEVEVEQVGASGAPIAEESVKRGYFRKGDRVALIKSPNVEGAVVGVVQPGDDPEGYVRVKLSRSGTVVGKLPKELRFR